jgi:hypothetical protein
MYYNIYNRHIVADVELSIDGKNVKQKLLAFT